MSVDLEKAITLVSTLIGGGGVIAFLKAKSEVRNSNKSADILALQQTIKTLQESHRELQDRYQEVIQENDTRCTKLAERLEKVEADHAEQSKLHNENLRRITELEIDLHKANSKIKVLEDELHKKNTGILQLQQENLELRKQINKHTGLME